VAEAEGGYNCRPPPPNFARIEKWTEAERNNPLLLKTNFQNLQICYTIPSSTSAIVFIKKCIIDVGEKG